MYVRILIIDYDMPWAKNWGEISRYVYTWQALDFKTKKIYPYNFLIKMHNLSKRYYTFIYDLRM